MPLYTRKRARETQVTDAPHRLNTRNPNSALLEAAWIFNDHKLNSIGESHTLSLRNGEAPGANDEWEYDSFLGTQVLDIQNDDHLIQIGQQDETELGLRRWTIITRFRLDSTKTKSVSNTGTGGVEVYPLVTKGRGESDGDNKDANYHYGLNASRIMAQDFEDTATGLNHPLTASTALDQDKWYDGAYTFDGSTVKLWYREVGVDVEFTEDGSLSTSAVPRYDSIQWFCIGSAANSSGTVFGNWGGQIAHVFIFNESLEDVGLGTFNYLDYFSPKTISLNLPTSAFEAVWANNVNTLIGSGYV